jgi:hypothetical protein
MAGAREKLDGCLQALKQMNDKSLGTDFEQFADVNKEAEDSVMSQVLAPQPSSRICQPSRTIVRARR